jgi:hypothetical protein
METINLEKTKKRTGKPITRSQQKQLRREIYQAMSALHGVRYAWDDLLRCYEKFEEAHGNLYRRYRKILGVGLTDDARSIKRP